jgi:hypothetical protein
MQGLEYIQLSEMGICPLKQKTIDRSLDINNPFQTLLKIVKCHLCVCVCVYVIQLCFAVRNNDSLMLVVPYILVRKVIIYSS